MKIRKMIIEGKTMDIVDFQEYERRAKFNDKDMLVDTCIEHEGTIYPIYSGPNQSRTKPYAVDYGELVKFFNSTNNEGYTSDQVVDLSDVATSRELIEKQNALRNAEIATLTANNSKKFRPIIRDEDSQALKLVKECLTKKDIAIDNYRSRFDSNCDFSNTIRLLVNEDNHSISIQKMQLIGEKFDIDFHIEATDKKNAPNPMNATFKKDL